MVDLQIIFHEVVKKFDNTIIYGHRSPELQFELFKQGRKQNSLGKWIVFNKKLVVTNCDGTVNQSRHNKNPSEAVDAAPYPINWQDKERLYYFAGYVKGVADRLRAEGRISHEITFGGDWDDDTDMHDQNLMDLVHFQIKL